MRSPCAKLLGSLLLSALAVPTISSASAMRVGSWNLRYDSQPDNITVAESLAALGDPLQEPTYLQNTSERPWSTRRVRVAELLLNKGVEVIGEPPFYLPSKSEW